MKCVKNGSELYVMKRDDFMRLFKTNEEAWRLMYDAAKKREEHIFQTCYTFVNVSNEANKWRDVTRVHNLKDLNTNYSMREKNEMVREVD